MLEKQDLPLFIRMKCNLLLGGLCRDVIEAKHHLDCAKSECSEVLISVSNEDKAMVDHYVKMVDEALSDLEPELEEFYLEN
jgi:hypothetical protein